ncbi:hypothetical protein [Pantoea sp. R102]|nr:hypothetical protein [Pantoea sp. R102]
MNSWKVETTVRFATWLQAQDDLMIKLADREYQQHLEEMNHAKT